MDVLLDSFRLNGHTPEFHTQILKLKLPYTAQETAPREKYCCGFHPQT